MIAQVPGSGWTPPLDTVVDALNRRDVGRFIEACGPGVGLEVRGSGELAPHNEQLWRAVTRRGRAQVRAYLEELFAALPSLHARADDVRGLPCWTTAVLELAGVDGSGLPFSATADVRLRGDGRRIRTVNLEVVDLEVGGDLLARADRDPRRYFEAFLGGADE